MDALSAAAAPSWRNLRLWIACFDLALDMFQMSRRMRGPEARPMSRRLIESASRLPVGVARGQLSGSSTTFILCLHDVLGDLSRLETHLLLCVERGHLPSEAVEAIVPRLLEIRRMAIGLERRLRSVSPAAARPAPRSPSGDGGILAGRHERGAALLMALLISATLAALGLAMLQMADVSMRTAARARDRESLLHVAESGAHAVKRWFDAPVSGDPAVPSQVRHLFLGSFDLRDASWFDLASRRIDTDANPVTPPVPADGTPGLERYRQGRTVSAGLPHLDLFHKPWRGTLVTTLLGLEGGGDLILEDRPGVVDLLDRLNASMFTDQAAGGRIERIEVHAPSLAGQKRLGFATATVTAALHRRLTLSEGIPVVPPGVPEEGASIVRVGLAEIPFDTPRGPMAACGEITVTGRLRARWGSVTALGRITLPPDPAQLDSWVDSAVPWDTARRHISGADLAAWQGGADTRVEDPWLRVMAGGEITGWAALGDHPFPFDPNRPADRDHSNLFQHVNGLSCPSFSYATWKDLVSSRLAGEPGVHSFAWDAATGLFRENGTGPARSVRDWTHQREGIFFFDTTDGLPPSGSNLTPAVVIAGGEWSVAGFIYLNASSVRVDGAAGTARVLIPPAEPWDDADADLVADPTETFVNLAYATTVESGSPTDEFHRHPLASAAASATSSAGETYTVSTSTSWDSRGLPIEAAVNLFGILYNAGDIVAEGEAVHFGSLVAGGSFIQTAPGAPSPIIYYDARIGRGEWPPPEIAIPRTFVTFWQTQHP